MEFSEGTVRSAKGVKSIAQIADDAKRQFSVSSYEHGDQNVNRLEQGLVWNGMLCTPTFVDDESIIHCRVRQSDDVDLVPKVQNAS